MHNEQVQEADKKVAGASPVQKLVFQQAKYFGVTVEYDAQLGVYFASGMSAPLTKFLKSVKSLVNVQVVVHAELNLEVTAESGGHDYKMAVLDSGKEDAQADTDAWIVPAAQSGGSSALVQSWLEDGVNQGVPYAAPALPEAEKTYEATSNQTQVSTPALLTLYELADLRPPDTAVPPPPIPAPPVLPPVAPPGPPLTPTPEPEDDRPSHHPNRTPAVANAIADQNAAEDAAFSFQFAVNAFSDDDGDPLTYTATLADDSALPAWLSFNAGTRTFSGTPADGDVGAISVKVTAADGDGETAEDIFDLTVTNTSDAPTVANAIADRNATEDAAFSFQFAANVFADPDSDPLTYTATLAGGGVLPAWLTFTAATRTFSGTPNNADVGTISVKVTANDGNGGTVDDTFDIAVANTPPVISAQTTDTLAPQGAAFTLDTSAAFTNVDGGTYSATAVYVASGVNALAGWLSFNTATGVFTGTPAAGDRGEILVTVTANDGKGGLTPMKFHIDTDNFNPVGGAGDDTVAGGAGVNIIYGGAGNDVLSSGIGNDRIYGGVGNDTLSGEDSDDLLYGGTGNDSLDGGRHMDLLDGGAGQDTLTGGIVGSEEDLYLFSDLSHSTTGIEDLITILKVNDYHDKIVLSAPLGITGIGAGATQVTISNDGVNTFITHNGSDFRIKITGVMNVGIQSFVFGDALFGSDGNDNLAGTAQDDNLVGSGGNDTISGVAGNDSIDGGRGLDNIDGGDGNDTMYGSREDDTLFGGTGNDWMDGGRHSDVLDGGAGQDTLYGGAGEINLFLFSGLTHSTAGTEDVIEDYKFITDGPDKVVLTSALGITGVGAGATEVTVSNNGVDTFITHNSSTFRIKLTGVFSLTKDHILFGDVIDGSNSGDNMTGTALNDNIVGFAGNDTINGADGDDIIHSDTGTDSLLGGNGNDVLYGWRDNDTLNGGNGQDTLSGGRESDTLILSVAAAGNDDHITDFKTQGTDKIAFSDAAFTFASGDGAKNTVALTDNTDIFDVAGFAGGSFGAGAGATFLYDTTDGQVWYDADGNGGGGTSVLIATIDNFASYTYGASDFIGWV